MPTTAPAIKFWQVTAGDASKLIAQLNTSTGPTATQLTSSPFDFADADAGLWSAPRVLLIEFAGNTTKNIDLKLYDTDTGQDWPNIVTSVNGAVGDNLADAYVNTNPAWTACWNFHITLRKTYLDPTDASFNRTPGNGSCAMDSWPALVGAATPFRLDTAASRPNPGNDSTANLLTGNIGGDTTRHLTNFFIYLAAKPKAAATAGTHLGWGIRTSYVYPGQ